MKPTITSARAAWVLSIHLLAWSFCLYVGGQLGAGWGLAAIILMELRAIAAAQSAVRHLRGKGVI